MTALEVDKLSHSFGGLTALADVSLAVAPGERRAIIGPNGAGKTTLFNIITGILRPSAGRIRLFGQDVTRLPTHRRAQLGLARTFQISTLFPRLTVLDSVLLACQLPALRCLPQCLQRARDRPVRRRRVGDVDPARHEPFGSAVVERESGHIV